MLLTGITSSDRQDDLTNVDTGNLSVGLSEGSTHTSLQSIGTSATQHLVDADDVVRMGANTQVETFLSGNLGQVLVGTDTGGFEGFRGDLFVFVGDEMHTCWEIVDTCLLSALCCQYLSSQGFVLRVELPAEIIDTNFRTRRLVRSCFVI
jgi:hypothetical protein